MGNLDTHDIMQRYVTGHGGYVSPAAPEGQRTVTITDRYFELFHRHKISLVGENDCIIEDHPCDVSLPRLNGSLFTAKNGYDGPGVGTPVGVYSIGTYGTWSWRSGVTESSMWQHADAWANWFAKNSPETEFFIYLEDEPPPQDYAQVETWSRWIAEDPGPGRNLLSLSTHYPVLARTDMPTLAIPMMNANIGVCPGNSVPCDASTATQAAADFYLNTPGRRLWAYGDSRPGVGSSDTEDDGVAFRVIPWGQYKKKIQRWFYWYVNLSAPEDWFQQAVTWGTQQYRDPVLGWYGNNGTTNGTGMLVYPGTDLNNPADSYGVDGPFASQRLKEWRRGIQDVDYITLAAQIDPKATQAIVDRVLPKALWEYQTTDPTFYIGEMSWSSDPDVWEAARQQLADIIVKPR
jgi:hypothetical protein